MRACVVDLFFAVLITSVNPSLSLFATHPFPLPLSISASSQSWPAPAPSLFVFFLVIRRFLLPSARSDLLSKSIPATDHHFSVSPSSLSWMWKHICVVMHDCFQFRASCVSRPFSLSARSLCIDFDWLTVTGNLVQTHTHTHLISWRQMNRVRFGWKGFFSFCSLNWITKKISLKKNSFLFSSLKTFLWNKTPQKERNKGLTPGQTQLIWWCALLIGCEFGVFAAFLTANQVQKYTQRNEGWAELWPPTSEIVFALRTFDSSATTIATTTAMTMNKCIQAPNFLVVRVLRVFMQNCLQGRRPNASETRLDLCRRVFEPRKWFWWAEFWREQLENLLIWARVCSVEDWSLYRLRADDLVRLHLQSKLQIFSSLLNAHSNSSSSLCCRLPQLTFPLCSARPAFPFGHVLPLVHCNGVSIGRLRLCLVLLMTFLSPFFFDYSGSPLAWSSCPCHPPAFSTLFRLFICKKLCLKTVFSISNVSISKNCISFASHCFWSFLI